MIEKLKNIKVHGFMHYSCVDVSDNPEYSDEISVEVDDGVIKVEGGMFYSEALVLACCKVIKDELSKESTVVDDARCFKGVNVARFIADCCFSVIEDDETYTRVHFNYDEDDNLINQNEDYETPAELTRAILNDINIIIDVVLIHLDICIHDELSVYGIDATNPKECSRHLTQKLVHLGILGSEYLDNNPLY